MTSGRALVLGLAFAAAALEGCGGGATAAEDAGAGPLFGFDGGAEISEWTETTCSFTGPATCPSSGPTYAEVAPIFEQSCVPCHSGATQFGPWPLTQWLDVAAWADLIQQDLTGCTMPPLDGGVPMSSSARAAVLGWLACDAPE